MAKVEEILKIAAWANQRTRAVIGASDNFYNPYPRPARPGLAFRVILERMADEESEEYYPEVNPFSRKIGVTLARCDTKNAKDKELIKELFKWHLDFTQDPAKEEISDYAVWMEFFSQYVPITAIPDIIEAYHENKKRSDELHRLEAEATHSIKFGAGNCAELSATALLYLLQYPATGFSDLNLPKVEEKILVERVAFPGKHGHAFLILNRRQGTINNFESWNNDTVICDPWTKEVYTKEELLEQATDEEQKAILDLLKNLLNTNHGNYFIGEQHNVKVHSDHWLKCHRSNKFWRPKKLLDLTERPVFPENLPRRQVTLKELCGALKTIDESKRLSILIDNLRYIQPIIVNQSDLYKIVKRLPPADQRFFLHEFGYDDFIVLADKLQAAGKIKTVNMQTLVESTLHFLTTELPDAMIDLAEDEEMSPLFTRILTTQLPFFKETISELLGREAPDLLKHMQRMINQNNGTALKEKITGDQLEVQQSHAEQTPSIDTISVTANPHSLFTQQKHPIAANDSQFVNDNETQCYVNLAK